MLHLIACVRTESYTPIERYRDEACFFDDICRRLPKKRSLPSTTQAAVISSWTIRPGANSVMKINAKPMPNAVFDLDRIAKEYVKVLNKVLAVKPKDMVITMHICRGNFRSTWFSSGGYGPIAKTLFAHCPVDGFFLEYDTDRAGDFNPLHHIKDQKGCSGPCYLKIGRP